MYTIFTYSGIDELRKIQASREIFPFKFVETKELLEYDTSCCIDITALVYFLQTNKADLYAAQMNLEKMDEDTVIIVEESVADYALELFPFLFFDYKDFFEKSAEIEKADIATLACSCERRRLYKYNNADELNIIIVYAKEHDIPIATFSQVNGILRDDFDQFNRSEKLALMDLTSLSYAIEDNKNLIYPLEQILSSFSNLSIIAQTAQVDVLLKYFPLFFDAQEPIKKLLPELSVMPEVPEKTSVLKVTELSPDKLSAFIEGFNHNLIGHKYFKERLHRALKNFISLNRVKEQKILSIFLFGASGIGKTEVARLFAEGLQENSYLAKINFQNYSSQDALNSLIGSPAGYVGCNHGELSEKIEKSSVGVLLCDEFEKTTRPVFSFFLELLEEGKFTDSMAREYNMDGYIIIFTSNIPNEATYKKVIPPELQTRFDLVCEFEVPTELEKNQFLDLLLEKATQRYAKQFEQIVLTEADKRKLYGFDYSKLTALRDIKRVFNDRLMTFFEEKGVEY